MGVRAALPHPPCSGAARAWYFHRNDARVRLARMAIAVLPDRNGGEEPRWLVWLAIAAAVAVGVLFVAYLIVRAVGWLS